MNEREIRGLSILSKGDTPKIVSEETFQVPSQSGNGKYRVEHRQEWSCTCPDHENRGCECKHIHSVKFWLKMRSRAVDDALDVNELVDLDDKLVCPACQSESVVSNGKRKTKTCEKQRYLCKGCGKRFVADPIKRIKVNAKMIALTIDLYFKGLSLRDISDTIYQFYAIRLHHETVRRWITNFTEKMNEYVENKSKRLSGRWKVDEQMVRVSGKWCWNWNVLDEDTKFLIASNLSETRGKKEAVKVLTKALRRVGVPKEIVTDGAFAYRPAIKATFNPQGTRKCKPVVPHTQLKTLWAKKNNNDVERYHGQFREFDKIRRGFDNIKTARKNADGFRLHYNYLRNHGSLGGTPAEKAGIDLELGRNKVYGLMMKSLAV